MSQLFTYLCHEKINYTNDISLLKFYPQSESLIYQAGQYIEIVLSNGTVLPLSIANAPNNDYLEIHLRHNQTQPLAQQLLAELGKTPLVKLRGPFGNMTLQKVDPKQKLVFLAGGTGFAPIKALLEMAFIEKRQTSMNLYWGISRPIDAYEEELIQKWRALFPQFDYTIVLSNPEEFPSWKEPTGLIPFYCASVHPSFENTYVFASGPFNMIKTAFPLLTQKGLIPNQFISDMQLNPIVRKQGEKMNPALG